MDTVVRVGLAGVKAGEERLRRDGGPPLLQARGVRKSYAGRLVVDVDELDLAAGGVLAILGPNGTGKSTLFRMLALLEKPDAGEVRYSGRPADMSDVAARRRIATVFQRPVVFQGKVRDNVALGLRLRRTPRKEIRSRVQEALELVDVAHLAGADARHLSGGELQRVALARALVLRPEVLFLDEPTSNLDPSSRARFRDDLAVALESTGATVILVTHDQAEALRLADQLAIMRDGRVVQRGHTEEVFSRPRDPFVAHFLGVETLWRSRVEECRDGSCLVVTRAGLPVSAIASSSPGREVAIAIRPEDVILEPWASAISHGTSARNRWQGWVQDVFLEGPVVRVRIRLEAGRVGTQHLPEGGLDDSPEQFLTALVTRPSAAELGLVRGAKVTALVKATAVHVLEDR
jgi:tungstate transport system ATP-binding protein